MRRTRVTVTVGRETLRRAERQVKQGRARSVSARVDAAMEEEARREELAALLAEMRAEAPSHGCERARGARGPRPVVLDAGGLIAFDRNHPRVRRLVELALEHSVRLHEPAGVLAQVRRDGSRQVGLARLTGSGVTVVRPLDGLEAQAAGARRGLWGTHDVVDASVAVLARRKCAVVLTSDPRDLLRLDPSLHVEEC